MAGEDDTPQTDRAEFMIGVTHELKTPIHSILGMGEALTDGVYGPLSDDQLRAIELTRRAAQQLFAMVENFLQYERAEADLLDMTVTEVDLEELLDSELDAAELIIGRKKVETRRELSVKRVRSIERIVRHIMRNLVGQSLKFSPVDGVVKVETTMEDGELVIAVSDQGPEVPEAERRDLFDAFWRVQHSPRAYGGSGFALGVVQRLAEVLGGGADVAATDAEGMTRFVVRFPVGAGEASPDST